MTPTEFEEVAELLRVVLVPTGGGKAHQDVRDRVEEFIGLALLGDYGEPIAKRIAVMLWNDMIGASGSQGVPTTLDEWWGRERNPIEAALAGDCVGQILPRYHNRGAIRITRSPVLPPSTGPRQRPIAEIAALDAAVTRQSIRWDPDGWYAMHEVVDRGQVYHRVTMDGRWGTAACARHLHLEPASYQPFNAVTPGQQCRRRACQRPTQ